MVVRLLSAVGSSLTWVRLLAPQMGFSGGSGPWNLHVLVPCFATVNLEHDEAGLRRKMAAHGRRKHAANQRSAVVVRCRGESGLLPQSKSMEHAQLLVGCCDSKARWQSS